MLRYGKTALPTPFCTVVPRQPVSQAGTRFEPAARPRHARNARNANASHPTLPQHHRASLRVVAEVQVAVRSPLLPWAPLWLRAAISRSQLQRQLQRHHRRNHRRHHHHCPRELAAVCVSPPCSR